MSDTAPLPALTPLDLPKPNDALARIHACARDLAWLVAQGAWDGLVTRHGHQLWKLADTLADLTPTARAFAAKWSYGDGTGRVAEPALTTLAALGYMVRHDEKTFLLTARALALLERPAQEPSVFVSYRRNRSSALALLVEARLRVAGHRRVFIDKGIPAGDDWHAHLRDQVQAADVVVALLAAKAFKSPYLVEELAWAREAGCTIIPLLHPAPDVPPDDAYAQHLGQRQQIRVVGESAKAYEQAVNELLNRLGYPTY